MRLLALTLAVAGTPAAADFSLDWPVDCTLGVTCEIQQYVDRDPGPQSIDFTGGPLSYDGHTGTDIRVPDLTDMGMEIRAAAPGVVRGVRDGVDDAFLTPEIRAALQGRGCGNGVVIDHADGWQTQYCHLKKGSISVKSGDAVPAGARLGALGLSGFTDFPHLELIVRKDGETIDPFDTGPIDDDVQTSLWAAPIDYQPGGVLEVGFSTSVPEFAAIKAGIVDPQALPIDAPALVAWGYYFGNQAGDTLRIAILGPTGQEVIAQDIQLDRTQAQGFRAIGRRLNAASWRGGSYTAQVTLIRNGAPIDEMRQTITLD